MLPLKLCGLVTSITAAIYLVSFVIPPLHHQWLLLKQQHHLTSDRSQNQTFLSPALPDLVTPKSRPDLLSPLSTQFVEKHAAQMGECGSIEHFVCSVNVTCGVTFIWLSFFYHAPQKSAAVNRRVRISEQPKLKYMSRFGAAQMVRKVAPHLPIALITDQEIDQQYRGYVDIVKTVSKPVGHSALSKAAFMQYSPFNRTLLLDMDVEVIRDPSGYFRLLDFYDVMAAPDSMTGGTTWSQMQEIAHPMEVTYNSGVMLYRSSACVHTFFNEWERLWEARFPHFMWRGPWDQVALAHTIRNSPKLRFGTLNYEANCIKPLQVPGANPVFIIHGYGCGAMVPHHGVLYPYNPRKYAKYLQVLGLANETKS